jgi:hypothetical protein
MSEVWKARSEAVINFFSNIISTIRWEETYDLRIYNDTNWNSFISPKYNNDVEFNWDISLSIW